MLDLLAAWLYKLIDGLLPLNEPVYDFCNLDHVTFVIKVNQGKPL